MLCAQADRATLARFDAIIDVRSPGEFAQDHVPGALNLPVLDDVQRAEVGTIYVQQSRLLARRIGAAYVARNIAGHLEGALSDRAKDFKPLIYCWRGGQRSHAMATVLWQVGWPVSVLDGGYKTYRAYVRARLYDDAPLSRIVLLDGDTGTAKTEILSRLAARGVQTLDLEGLAGHRGSLFGAIPGRSQPSQKMFESRLLARLGELDPARPIVVEAESSRVGERMTPPVVWRAMKTAPGIVLSAPRDQRALYLVRTYRDGIEERSALEDAFTRLPVHPGRQRLADWRELADAGKFAQLAEALMEQHYDPAYARSSRKDDRPRLGEIALPRLDDAAQESAVDEIVRLIGGDVSGALG
jgi:tRNA 2-selenouridine synthase